MSKPPPGWLRELRRAVTWHRRLLAAGLAAIAVTAGLTALAPAPPPTVRVVAAARDLPAGVTLTTRDVRTVTVPPDWLPDGALPAGVEIAGRVLGGPIRRGEVLTDVRLVGPALLDGYADAGEGAEEAGGAELVATPVRLADAEVARLLQPGDRVDVLAAATRVDGATATVADVVAAGVRVLLVPDTGETGSGPAVGDGALVVLATTPHAAATLAAAAVNARLSVALRS